MFKKAFICSSIHQMNGRILAAVLIAFILFGVYSWYTRKPSESFNLNTQIYEPVRVPEVANTNKQMYETVHVSQPPLPPVVHHVVPSGPNVPSQLPPPTMPPVIIQEERPFDPQEQNHESAEIPEKLRYPERLYSPGLNNEEFNTAAAMAGAANKVTTQANQVFGPDLAQNGGNFMGEVLANDASMKTNYSSF